MNTVDFVDLLIRERDVLLQSSLEAAIVKDFLHYIIPRHFDVFVEMIQTAGGSGFKKEFVMDVSKYCNIHRVARPYKKNEQSFVESFNRSLRKECLGWIKYQESEIPGLTRNIEDWLRYYHYVRLHISLGMRPPLDIQV